MLPRAKLLRRVLEPLVDHLTPMASGTSPLHFTTSPARLLYRDKEMVLHRDDILKKMQQVSFSDSTGFERDVTALLTSTLLSQGHLAPFSPSLKPTMWNFDHALQLHPLPSTLCLSDGTAPSFETQYVGTKVFNPGHFVCDGSFVVFEPDTEEVTVSKIP